MTNVNQKMAIFTVYDINIWIYKIVNMKPFDCQLWYKKVTLINKKQ